MTKSMRYSTMMYYSIMILGIGEMGPVNTEEYVFLIFALLFSLMLQSLFFSDIAVLVTSFFRKRTEQQGEIDKAFEVMTFIELPEDKQDQIRDYFAKTQSTKEF